MPIFYRGAGINTYWYLNDPIVQGFTARAPGITASPFQQMHQLREVLLIALSSLLRALMQLLGTMQF